MLQMVFSLRCLKELYLDNNAISKIEGLEGCSALRKLWLFSNRISSGLDQLESLPDLRELWIQDNCLTRLNGMERVTQLQALALSGNRILEFRDLLVRHISPLFERFLSAVVQATAFV